MMAKKVMIMMIAGMMSVMSLTACGENGQDAQSKVISSIVADHSESTADASGSTALADPSSVLAGGDDTTQIPNPWEQYTSLADAAKAAGFEMSIPERPRMFTKTTYQVMKDENETILEVLYSAEDSGEQMMIRKASGAGENADISGDYNVYNETSTVTVGEYTVTLKGND